jgi:hypothetical protein
MRRWRSALCLLLFLAPPALVRGHDSKCRLEVRDGVPGSRTQLLHSETGRRFRFVYLGSDGVIEYCLLPGGDFWGPVNVKLDRIPVAHVLVGAGPVFSTEPAAVRLIEARAEGERARARWEVLLDGEAAEVESSLELRGRSLRVEYFARGAEVTAISLGRLTDVASPELIDTGRGGSACPSRALKSTGVRTFFASLLTCFPGAGVRRAVPGGIRGDEVWLGGEIQFPEPSPEGYGATGVLTISRIFGDVLPRGCAEPR